MTLEAPEYPFRSGEGRRDAIERRDKLGMLTLRCTRVVRARLRLPDVLPEPPRSTGVLGDWYVHLMRFGRDQLVLATSERSLLSVLMPARDLQAQLAPRLRDALAALLDGLGTPRAAIMREIGAMEPVSFGPATNRQVLGSMNDFAFQASVHWAGGEGLGGISRRLARTPMSAIGGGHGHLGFPDQVAEELLSAYSADVRRQALTSALDVRKERGRSLGPRMNPRAERVRCGFRTRGPMVVAGGRPALQDEIKEILREQRSDMSTRALADAIQHRGRYRRRNGAAVTASEVTARVSRFPQMFGRSGSQVRLKTQASAGTVRRR